MNGLCQSPPLLPADEADARIRDLLVRNANLEDALKHTTAFCHLKKSGFCYAACKAVPFCQCSGLSILSYADMPDAFVEAIRNAK